MKILCVTGDCKLMARIGAYLEQLEWQLLPAVDLDQFRAAMGGQGPDMILADTADSRILEWWNLDRPSGRPVVFIRNKAAELSTLFERLARLHGKRNFSKFNLIIDSERQVARVGESRLALTLTELRLLRELAGVEMETVAREALESCMFGSRGSARRTLDVHICSLRKKLKGTGLIIESVRGVGYRLSPCRT